MAGAQLGAVMRQIGRLFDQGTVTGLADAQLLDRFVGRGDGLAFTALVERHGPMVLRVCRAILGNGDEVEDAFQATFLVLIRKSATIRGRDALGAWLHRVAYRIAIQSRIEGNRRRKSETSLGDAIDLIADKTLTSDQARIAAIHEELARLPEKYRRPIVLCYLEGLTHAQAASALGWGEATVRRRLTDARDLLRSRLTRQGLAPAVSLLLIDGMAKKSSAVVPLAWSNAIAKAAVAMPSGKIVATGGISATAATLAKAALAGLFAESAKGIATVSVLLVALGMVGMHMMPIGLAQTGATSEVQKQAPDLKKAPSPLASPKPNPTPTEAHLQSFTFSGHVVDPEGKPFPGAKITLEGTGVKVAANPPVRAISGQDGGFRFECLESDFVPGSGWPIPIGSSAVARAKGFALGAAGYRGVNRPLPLRLALDNVPITGQILDVDGKPIPGISVSVRGIRESQTGELTEWLKVFTPQNPSRPQLALDRKSMPMPILQGIHPLFPPSVTDKDGRFQISGIGRDRLVELRIEGPTIESAVIMARTQPGPKLGGSEDLKSPRNNRTNIIYGASLIYTPFPSMPIEGLVRDRETGKPLAGITIRSEYPTINKTDYISATTDAEGRYRLTGLSMNQPITLLATAPCDRIQDVRGMAPQLPDESLPYMRSTTRFPGADPKSKDPIRLDFNLQRGVWAFGRVFDKTTGQPVRARVSYAVYQDNPTLLKLGIESFRGNEYGQDTTANGSFRLAVFPGPGLIGVRTNLSTDYVMGVGAESLPRLSDNAKNPRLGYSCAPLSFRPELYNRAAEINPKPDDPAIEINFPFDRGHVLKVEIVDPNGNLAEVDAASGLDDRPFWNTDIGPPRTDFSVLKLVEGKKRIVTVRNANKALIGQIELDGKEERPARLTLVPWGEIKGRVVFSEGKGFSEEVQILSPSSNLETPAPWLLRIQKDGTFRIEGLVPGRSYTFFVTNRAGKVMGLLGKDLIAKSGEVTDLGNVQLKPWP